jgi:hypothetical protein
MVSVFSARYCWLTTLKRVQQSQTANTHLSWMKCKRSTVSPGQCLLTHGCHHRAKIGRSSLWSADTPCPFIWFGPFRLPNFKNIWTGWNFQPQRIPWLLQVSSLQPNRQHSIWMIYRNCSSGIKSVINSGGSMLNKVSVLNYSMYLLQSQRIISNLSYPMY